MRVRRFKQVLLRRVRGAVMWGTAIRPDPAGGLQGPIQEPLTPVALQRRRAAELLEISPETLRYRVENYGLKPGGGKDPR